MNDCIGIFGKLFGHKFIKRVDREEGDGKWPFTHGTIESRISATHNDEEKARMIYATKTIKETYVYDICVRCGKVVKR